MFSRRLLTPRKIILFAYDLGATLMAAYLAILILNQSFFCLDLDNFKLAWYFFPVFGGIIFYLLGFYDQMWVYASLPQYLILAGGTLLQTFFITMLMQILHLRFHFVTYVLYYFLITLAVTGIRFLYRLWFHYNRRHFNQRQIEQWTDANEPGMGHDRQRNVLIVGSGQAGNQVIKELQEHQLYRTPVALVDDNPQTHGMKNLGVPVLGDRNAIPEIVKRYNIDEIILAIPSAKKEDLRAVVNICHQTPAKVKTVPFLAEILTGKAKVADFRDLEFADLLGREQVCLENDCIDEILQGKTVLVTGGGGSIGSELARQIVKFRPQRLVLFDIYENNVYDLQQELKLLQPELGFELIVQIGSVRDPERLDQLFATYQPQVVFHAAAHKHVPLMEDSREDAVKNNVYGTLNVAEAAGRHGSGRMILISTDKAVHPTNCMGATKRLAEMIMCAMNVRYPQTRYGAVRFGNVLGSAGSVIPLFQRQIREEHRVTLTHPDIRRYFMTIPEAASLVLQAAAYAQGGEIFILDMGEPVKIIDLAKSLIRFAGYEPETEIPIEIIGLRPGEKLFEELFLDKENSDKTRHEKIFVLQQVHERQALEEETAGLIHLIHSSEGRLTTLCAGLIDAIAQGA